MGIIRSAQGQELLYARSAVVTAAAAYELQSIDMVCLDYKEDAVLERECEQGRTMGFTGKVSTFQSGYGVASHSSPSSGRYPTLLQTVCGRVGAGGEDRSRIRRAR